MTVHVGKLHRRKEVGDREAGSVRHSWYLIGARGAAQFIADEIFPGTALHAVYSGFQYRVEPMAANGAIWNGTDVGHHSPVPTYEDQPSMGECHILEGDCFYDGSGLAGQDLCQLWASLGFDDDVIWSRLEGHYRYVFLGED